MKTELYYFSGTGNSLYAAEETARRIEGSRLIPIIACNKKDRIKTNADAIGLVFPNFCLSVPIPVHQFLSNADISSAEYIFAVCTRGGTVSQAFDFINKIIKVQKKKLNAQININMPWNHPLGKENTPASATDEEIAKLDRKMHEKLDEFCKAVINRESYIKKDTDITFKLPFIAGKLFLLLLSENINFKTHRHMYAKVIQFYSDDKCTGCGICEQVCPNGKIKMADGKPVWQEKPDCLGCFACINYCPGKAIQIKSGFPVKSYTKTNDRYHHPSISYKDIAAQKQLPEDMAG